MRDIYWLWTRIRRICRVCPMKKIAIKSITFIILYYSSVKALLLNLTHLAREVYIYVYNYLFNYIITQDYCLLFLFVSYIYTRISLKKFIYIQVALSY